jgi:hypothetical protein
MKLIITDKFAFTLSAPRPRRSVYADGLVWRKRPTPTQLSCCSNISHHSLRKEQGEHESNRRPLRVKR